MSWLKQESLMVATMGRWKFPELRPFHGTDAEVVYKRQQGLPHSKTHMLTATHMCVHKRPAIWEQHAPPAVTSSQGKQKDRNKEVCGRCSAHHGECFYLVCSMLMKSWLLTWLCLELWPQDLTWPCLINLHHIHTLPADPITFRSCTPGTNGFQVQGVATERQ